MKGKEEEGKEKEEEKVKIRGKNKGRKRNEINDLNLVAECVLHFAKTGELYPKLKWEEVA